MAKRDKLKEILRVMNGDAIDFSAFDKSVAELRKQLEDKVVIPTLDKVNSEIDNFRKKIDFTPLLTSLDEVKKTVNNKIAELSNTLDIKIKEQEAKETESRIGMEDNFDKALSQEINALRVQIAGLDTVSSKQLTDTQEEIKALDKKTQKAIADIKIPDDREQDIKDINEAINKLRIDLINRINERGGGNMNRQVFFNSADYLKKYTDINWKAGTNVTFTIADNNQTKKVDITVSATGGGGGSVRSIQSISSNTTAGATAGTDYVYLVTGTTTLTMPTAGGGNTNLYTIKNVGSGVVTIAFNGVETGDGQTTLVMPVQYTSIDLISDSVNWAIT